MRPTLCRASRLASSTLMLLAMLLTGTAAKAADVEGVLTLRWGDAVDGAPKTETLQAEIIGKNGYTYQVAAAQALADGLPIYDMNGHDVVASLDARRKTDAGFRLIGIASKSGAAVEPVADARPWINLLCKFADVSDEPTTAARVDASFAPGGGLTQFWDRTSGGFVDLGRSKSIGWFVLPSARAAYFDGNGNPNLGKLLTDCSAAAGTTLADAVQAEDHAGVNVLVNGSLGCCAWGGSTRSNIGGVTKTWRVTWLPPSGYLNLSLFGHELAHAYGMSHSNNSDGDSNTYDNPWDLMSDCDGHAVRSSQFGLLPKTPSAYHLDRAGWLDADEKITVTANQARTVQLQRVDQPSVGGVRLVRIEAPEATDGRYYTVEARVRGGTYDAQMPDSGVVIYEVDPRRAQPAWLVDNNNPASNYSNTRSVVFKAGDRYIAPDRSFEIKVVAAGADAFQIEVVLPGPGFSAGFE